MKKGSNVVLSVKVPEYIKTLTSNLAIYRHKNQGQILEESLLNYAKMFDYNQHVKKTLEEKGIFLSKIIYESVEEESKKLFKNRENLIRTFFDEFDQGYGDISILTVNDLEDLVDTCDLIVELEEYSYRMLVEHSMEKFDTFLENELKKLSDYSFSKDFLFNIFNLKEILDIEVLVQLQLINLDSLHDFSFIYYLEQFLNEKNPAIKMDFDEVLFILNGLTLEERTWFYTLSCILNLKLKGRPAGSKKIEEMINEVLEEKKHYIFQIITKETISSNIQEIHNQDRM